MDCRCAGFLARRFVQHEPFTILKEVRRRPSGTQAGTPMYGIFAPGASSKIRAMARAGAMPASSFRGPHGCSPATPASSTRIGPAWRNISTPSSLTILTFCGRRIPASPSATGCLQKARPAANRCHRLLGIRRYADAADGARRGQSGRRKEISQIYSATSARHLSRPSFSPMARSTRQTIAPRPSARSTIPMRWPKADPRKPDTSSPST